MTGRRVLVVGGTGFIGSTVAAHLVAHGDRVTVGSRSPRRDDAPPSIAGLPTLIGDHVTGTYTAEQLGAFDAIVFSAGSDTRHVAADDEDEAHWEREQSRAVPAFVELARDAGVGRVVQLGSAYHHAMPEISPAPITSIVCAT